MRASSKALAGSEPESDKTFTNAETCTRRNSHSDLEPIVATCSRGTALNGPPSPSLSVGTWFPEAPVADAWSFLNSSHSHGRADSIGLFPTPCGNRGRPSEERQGMPGLTPHITAQLTVMAGRAFSVEQMATGL